LLEKLVWVRVIIAGKLVSVPVISFSIPSYAVDALLCRNLASFPPSHGTLRITLLSQISCSCSGFYQIFSWVRTSMDLFGNLGLTFGFLSLSKWGWQVVCRPEWSASSPVPSTLPILSQVKKWHLYVIGDTFIVLSMCHLSLKLVSKKVELEFWGVFVLFFWKWILFICAKNKIK
jgi:hypothetical protein